LLDEITVDLDVVGRLDLLQFFIEECEVRGATIIYATHIFDGLERWITHLAYVSDGHLQKSASTPASMLGLGIYTRLSRLTRITQRVTNAHYSQK
jgi:ABC-type uncharacterized transport system ATPase subunit